MPDMNTNKPTVRLTGQNGNAFSIMAACRLAARKAGWSKEQINDVLAQMRSGDYNHLLRVAMEHFDVE